MMLIDPGAQDVSSISDYEIAHLESQPSYLRLAHFMRSKETTSESNNNDIRM